MVKKCRQRTPSSCINLPLTILLMRRPNCAGARPATAKYEAATKQEPSTLWVGDQHHPFHGHTINT